ncbi:MAG: hypothetical protein JWM21_921 [Acidobacteria bacterium]|nr:hypothetical protein [Acidobacteriota bacterium]
MTPNTRIQEQKEEPQLMTAVADSSRLMSERKDVLLGLYQENRTHLRHHESQRSTVTNIILVTTVGLVGLVRELTFNDWPLLLAMILVGAFGTVFNAKQNEQVRRYKARSWEYDEALDELLFKGTTTLKSIREKADDESSSKFSLVRVLWPLAISITAAGFFIYIYQCLPHDK